jgi:uncharacterized membrane protein
MSKRKELQTLNEVPQSTFVAQQEFFAGPLPPQETLKGYKDIDPDFPEWVMKMAEAHAAADVHQKYKESSAVLRGQIFSFLISCLGFGTAIIFAVKGIEAGAITATIGGIAPIVVAALTNLKKDK